MTKKKRELIEILLENITPDDWPEDAKWAAQDKETLTWGKNKLMFYKQDEPPFAGIGSTRFSGNMKGNIVIQLPELCKKWSKSTVTRDKFMKRWDERNPVVDSEGWIQWNGGKMPVEKGTLIDVKYRIGLINLHVKAGEDPSGGSIPNRCAIDFKHDDNLGDIIAYRLHVPKQQKTPQRLALEKFGTDWHDNEGVQPVDSGVMVDLIMSDGDEKKEYHADYWSWHTNQRLPIKKWRIHSDDKESQISEKEKALKSLMQPMPPCSEEIPCHFVDAKSPLSTQVGGNHYTELAIQPMQYSMANNLDALQHTVIKYVTRFRDKNGIEDLEKAKHCIDMLIEFEKERK